MNETEKIRKKVKELGITEKTLVYPTKLKNLIKSSEKEDENVAFIKFVPKSTKSIIPPVQKKKKADSEKLAEEDSEKIKFRYLNPGIDAIVLPIVPTEDQLSGEWQSVEGAAFGSISEYLSWKAKKALGGIASAVLPEEAVFAMKEGMFGGGIDNPYDKMAFAGHSRRSFQIAYEFIRPSNKQEEEILTQIVSMFRMGQLGAYGGYVITPPMNWEVTFSSFPNYKNFLRYKRCGLSSVTTNFGGDTKFKVMKSGSPFMSLSLDFSELDYPSKNDVYLKPSDSSLIKTGVRDATQKEQEKMKRGKEQFNKAQENNSGD